MLVLIIAKCRLQQEIFYYGSEYNRIIFAMFFYFSVLKIHPLLAKFCSQPQAQTTYFKKICIRESFAPRLPSYNQVKICA